MQDETGDTAMTSITVNTATHAEPSAAPIVERGTRLRRRATGVAAIGAGTITLAGFLTCPWENAPGEGAYLNPCSGTRGWP
jgi:hypothetical protein